MKRYSRSRSGSNTVLLFVVGALALLLLSLKKGSTSGSQAIAKVLTAKGYSPRVVKWWTAISNFETAKWTSRLYREAHNLFGMKQPLSRQTTSLGPFVLEGVNWASFSDDESSVSDLVLYMENFNYPKDFSDLYIMIAFMKSKGYFQESIEDYFIGVEGRLS